MFDKIFRSSFITSMLVLIISSLLIFGVLLNYFEGQVFSELVSEADYISYAIKSNPDDFFENFKNSEKRITIISSDGTVLADTQADAEELDNHLNRSEIVEAIKSGSGTSTRYSKTLMQKNLYYAKKLDDGMIVRVSTAQNSVIVILLGILQPIIFIIVFALIISIILSNRVSKSIIKPINSLDLENPASNEAYEELTPLLKKISVQKKIIDRQIKDANKKSEEFKLITENMSEGFLVIDNDCVVLSYNSAASRLLEAEITKNGSVLEFNRTQGFIDVVQAALSGKRAQRDIVHEDSIYNLIANPVYENEKIIGAVIVILDITEGARREQLRRQFTSNVSHELKTPLTSISGFAEIMKSGGVPSENVIDFSTSVYDEAQRLISLVSDIMKISELDEGETVFEKQRIDIYAIAQNVVNRLKPIAKKQSIEINIKGEKLYVLGNEKILDEMIYNLCDNAIKYNNQNGKVFIAVRSVLDMVEVSVRDTGIGIPKNEETRVFERFYRVDKSRSKAVGGTGLGLAIVKHGAMYHNAKIRLESVEGAGTNITVSFKKA